MRFNSHNVQSADFIKETADNTTDKTASGDLLELTESPQRKNRAPRVWPVILCGVLPLLALAGVPFAKVMMSPYGPVDVPLRGNAKKRYEILTKIPKNPDVLVNVRLEHLPSTHDMTLLGKVALPALEKGLTHNTNPSVRNRIAVVLTEMADHQTLDALQAAMKDWNLSIRMQAMNALAAVGSLNSKPVLEKVLNDPEERKYTKALAIRALGRIGAASVAPRLLGYLSDKKENYSMRMASLTALWDLRVKTPRKLLRRGLLVALDSEMSNAKIFAAAATAELRDKDRKIRRALLKNTRDPNNEVRNVSVYALGEIGDDSAVQALRERLPAARSGRLLNNIAFALHKLKDPQVLSSLGKLLKHRQAVIRLNAAFVLGDTGEKKAVPMLLTALNDGNDSVRASTVAALGKLEDERAVPALERIARSSNLSLKLEALKSLNKIKNGAYNDRFAKEFLNSKNYNLRKTAALELARFGDARSIDVLLSCLGHRMCSPHEVAKNLKKIKSWRSASAAVTAYSLRAGSWGERSLLNTITEQKLRKGHVSILRNFLPIIWHRKGSRIALTRTLGKLRDKASRPAYWSMLSSRDQIQVINGAQALANDGYDRGTNILLTNLTQGAPSTKRTIAHLMKSIENKKSLSKIQKEISSALSGHGMLTRAAAAFVMTEWNAEKGLDILVKLLESNSRRVRNEAGYYLTHSSMREHVDLLKKKLAKTNNDVTEGALNRILMTITPARFKPKLWQRLPF